MSWDADDAMLKVVDDCINGNDSKDVAIDYLEKKISENERGGGQAIGLKRKLKLLK